MEIEEIELPKTYWSPGENLSQQGGEYTHVLISYNIAGNRDRIDEHVKNFLTKEDTMQKIDLVNTTIYWQEEFGNEEDDSNLLNNTIKEKLKKKLLELFLDKSNPSKETVTAFCLVGNVRAFAFKINS